MKRAPLWAWCAVASLLLIGAGAASATDPTTNNNGELLRLKQQRAAERAMRAPAESPRGGESALVPPLVGDDFASAIEILSIPLGTEGNTCDYLDDYSSANCGIATGPDLVYRFTPDEDVTLSFSLCGSSYDTQITIFKDDEAQEIACNDDYCGLQSYLPCVEFHTGHTYYIVVDGFAGDCGDYELVINYCSACDTPCPHDAWPEGEPFCFEDYDDDFNGGCNSDPPVFTPVQCEAGTATICGTAGTYLHNDRSYRDTDWYELCVSEPTLVRACVKADFLAQVIILRLGDPDPCPYVDYQIASADSACQTLCVEYDVTEPGRYAAFVSPQSFSGVPCGSPYTLTIDGCFPCDECTAQQPVLVLGDVRTVSYTWPLWEVQVRLMNTGGPSALARNVTAELGSDLAWLEIPDPTCYYGDLAPGDYGYGLSGDSSYVFDLTDWPGGSFNAWFDVTYEDTCEHFHIVHFDPDFLDPEQATGVTAGDAPIAAARLLPNAPNPFNPQTTISFEIPRATHGDLAIYNASGQLVRELWKGDLAAGQHSFVWNGRDDRGNSVPSGTYLYRLRSDGFTDTRRMVLIR